MNIREIMSNQREAVARLKSAAKKKASEFTWLSGVSRGRIKGEIRAVMDETGEREFYIVPPFGPAHIKCTFDEKLRPLIKEYLWETVEVDGLLHRTSKSPHPYMVEATEVTKIAEGPALKDFASLLPAPDGDFSIDAFDHE